MEVEDTPKMKENRIATMQKTLLFSPNSALEQTKNDTVQSARRKVALKMETITLSPSDYSRPKTAVNYNEQYTGGFFNTKINFQKQIED